MKNVLIGLWVLGIIATVGCSSSETPISEPNGQKQELIAKGDCTFAECGSVPPSYQDKAKVECSGGPGECSWEPSDPSPDVATYGFCEESECPPRPTIECPAGTVRASQQCGNENNRGCAWSTVCTPPRVTKPCADEHGCNGQALIDIGIICQDGSYGSFVCVTDDRSCFWERSCD